jgi:hypothetical protein
MSEIKLRTRYRIVFLYRELRNGKCIDTPMLYKNSGAVDGDAFKEYVQFAKEVYDSLPKKCILDDGWTGVCIITYIVKEKFVYHAKVEYIFKTRKDGVPIAFKVDVRTGKKKQINQKTAMRRHKAQGRRIITAKKKHKVSKKKVIKQYQMYAGCRSPDMAYKGV